MLLKLDDVGFVYDIKNNKSITSNDRTVSEPHISSFRKLMIEKYGSVC
jgi:hypothetical protein